jgi:uncharacterized protein YbjT (DUF2867 family)
VAEGKSLRKRTRSHDRAQQPHPATVPHSGRVLLTGASGFVGREILRQLLAQGHEVVAVARSLRGGDILPGVIQVAADVTGIGWQRWCEGCSAAIHLVGIIREAPRTGVTFDRTHRLATEQVIKTCREIGIPRLVHMSTLGAKQTGPTPYLRSKWEGEQAVRGSGLRWTIFRPSVIFGPGDGLSSVLAAALRRFPVFPVFGDGRYSLQPVAVEEVARCFVDAIDLPAAVGETYELGGPEAITYDELLRRVAAAVGVRRSLVHLPLGLSRALVSFLQLFPNAPITRDQLTMLLASSTCDDPAATLVFGAPTQRYEGPTWLRASTG